MVDVSCNVHDGSKSEYIYTERLRVYFKVAALLGPWSSWPGAVVEFTTCCGRVDFKWLS